MSKLASFPVLLLVGCVIAGLYGTVHDQISYTVSPDYYFHYKFIQFQIPEGWHNRAGAAIVGWEATWWMGLIIGIPVLLIGLILPDAKTYTSRCMIAMAVVAGTALVAGLGALVYASCTVTAANLPDFWFPDGVQDRVAFARVGIMHDFSYAGGLLGIVTGSLYLIVERMRLGRRR